MAGYLLDTNHIGDTIRRVSRIRDRIQQTHRLGIKLGTCINVVCELEAGIQHLKQPSGYRRRLNDVLTQVRLWPIDLEIARRYGEVFFELQRLGRNLSHVDMLLVALARRMNLTLLTTDRDFEILSDIRTENWLN
jgi:predicted nucleic acid-binding protein